MFFENQKYFEFVEAAKAAGINVPIIPGIKPIAVKRHLQLLPQVFKIDLPEELINEVEIEKNILQYTFNGSNLAAGTYLLRLQDENNSAILETRILKVN